MSRKRMSLIVLLIALLVVGCGQKESNPIPPHPNAVASYKGGVITKDQIKAKYDSLMACCKDRYQGSDGRRRLIKEMVLPVVISRAIKHKKIDLRGNIREELGNLQDKLNMSFLHIKFHEQILANNEKHKDLKATYEFQKKRLEGFPLSERFDRLVQLNEKIHPLVAEEVKKMTKDYIGRLRREASITKNYEVLNVQLTDEELKDFYQQHKQGLHDDEYRVPERVRIQEIVIESANEKENCPTCPKENNRQAKEKANAALLEIRSGADFQTVAKMYAGNKSEETNPRWLARGTEPIEFEEAVFTLEDGEVSQVLEKESAFHIVKVLKKQPGRFKSYEEILNPLEREYRWQKGEKYLRENRDRILFTINSKPYTIGDFLAEYTRENPPHQCHHMQEMDQQVQKMEDMQPCDFSHNSFKDQKMFVDGLIDRELITEDTYNQMIHVEHGKEIEFLTMASLYPIFHREEMQKLIHISDDMVRNYYDEKKEIYKYPAKAKLSMIVIKGGDTPEDKEGALERAKKAYSELKPSFFSFKKEKDFAEVARKYSEDQETAVKGGRLDVDVYECRNAIEFMLMHGFHKQIFKLNPGDISDIFEFENNYYIVQIRELEARKQLALEDVREKVKEDLYTAEHQKVMENWEDELLKAAGFKIYDQVLQQMLAETEDSQKTKES
ncbi:MAG: peptidyl-prolyl cis-trans isomerase [Desulfobacterales bacterium]|nr:MAG: peptidyl-prolyl cis-trans isomerase [Desulfobacterales bacterium]